MVLAGDIKKAFLQIWINESERDALWCHCRPSHSSEVETYRFTRVLFGLAPYPSLLGGVLERHLETEHLRRSFYVDDLFSSRQDVQQARTRKEIATEIMNDASFELHKWHSNELQLEDRPHSTPYEEQSYAKTAATSPVKPVEVISGQLEQGGRHDCCTVPRSKSQAEQTRDETCKGLRPPRSRLAKCTTRETNLSRNL